MDDLKASTGKPKRSDIRLLKDIRKNLSKHLKEHHSLIPRGQYLTRYTLIGLALGFAVGILTTEFTLMGAFFGAIIGIAIGSKRDMEAREKGIEI